MFGITGPDLAFVSFMIIALFALIIVLLSLYREHKRGNPQLKDFKTIWRSLKRW